MKIDLKRNQKTSLSTIGDISINGIFFGYSLERNEVMIPTGTYAVELTHSLRFNRLLPILMRVPGREGIRIHAGNYPRDSEGCILVGYQKGQDSIFQSQKALYILIEKITQAISDKEPITIYVS